MQSTSDEVRTRRWPDLLLLILALLLGATASAQLRSQFLPELPPAAAWGLLAVAALLAGLAFVRMERWLADGAPPPRLAEFPVLRRQVAGLLALLGGLLIAGWVVQRLWPDVNGGWRATLLPWAGSLLLVLAAGWLLRALGQPGSAWSARRSEGIRRESPFSGRVELLLVFLIFALAVVLRLYRLDSIPPAIFVDETNGAADAIALLEGNLRSPFTTGWYETPYGFIYFMAGLFKLLGANYLSLKLVSIIPSLLTIPAVYLLARQLFGVTAGLLAMYLLAVSRWHMTMSRWAWNETAPPLFFALSAFFLVRGLRERRALDYAAGGLLGGLMIYTYLSSRLAVATLILFAFCWLLADPDGPVRSWRRAWRGLLLYGLAALVAAAPLCVTYLTVPFTFFNRSTQISIFREIASEGQTPANLTPLWENVWDQVQLFFEEGDPNGRHNLPGEPQTDPITGLFLAAGVGYALLRLRDRRRMLLLLWLALGLAAGFLSESNGSPNSYRTLNALVAVVILAADGLDRTGRGLAALGQRRSATQTGWPVWAAGALVLALAGGAGGWEINTYFGRQAGSSAVQNSFNRTETIVARDVAAALDAGESVYLTPRYYNFSPLRFLVWGTIQARTGAASADHLPYRLARPEVDLPVPAAGGGALFLLDPYYESVMDYFRLFYPNAEIGMERGPDGGAIYLRAWVAASDLRARQGLNAEVRRGDGSTETLSLPAFQLDSVGGDVVSVLWTGSLRLENSGSYELVVEGDGRLTVDGTPWQGTRYLGRGLHGLEIEQNGTAPVSLAWRKPDGAVEVVPTSALFNVSPPQQGLWATYYANDSWSGPPLMEQITPFLLLAWPPNEPTFHPFSATYNGLLRIETPGFYRFRIEADDGVRLALDGAVLGEALIPDRPNTVNAGLDLAAGDHPLQIDYFQKGGGSVLEFFWSPPNSGEVPVPPSVLLPGR